MLKSFTNRYPVTKTLRFELEPIGETQHFIDKSNFINKDNQLNLDYQEVKKIIDKYHKQFIDEALSGAILCDLEKFSVLYNSKKDTDDLKTEFANLHKYLRQQIVDCFTKNQNPEIRKRYENLFKKELITKDLILFASTEEKLLITKFNKFTTYFTGFNENRKNIYSNEEISTSVAYRCIHQNLYKYLDNIKTFERIKNSSIAVNFNTIVKDLEPIIQEPDINTFFTLNNYNNFITQMDIDRYNTLIGGITPTDGKEKIQGLNEYINKFNQTQSDKNKRIPKLKFLFKQILSDRNIISYVPDKFENDTQLIKTLNEFTKDLNEFVNKNNETHKIGISQLISNIREYNLNSIFVSTGKAINHLSNKLFGTWDTLNQLIIKDYDTQYTGKIKTESEKYIQEREKYINNKYFSLQNINELILKSKLETKINNVEKYFESLCSGPESLITLLSNAEDTMFKNLTNLHESETLISNQNAIDSIKYFLDLVKALNEELSILNCTESLIEKNETFYSDFDYLYNKLSEFYRLYNKVRNYLTQKPYRTDKFKLNFENSTLLKGWDISKEQQNKSILLVKDNNYFVGIINPKEKVVFKESTLDSKVPHYKKMKNKLLTGAHRMLPKVIFSKKNMNLYKPSEKIIQIRNTASFTKSGKPQNEYEKAEFNLNDCRLMIDFFKESIIKNTDWNLFKFQFRPTHEYFNIKDFYSDVEEQGYKIEFSSIAVQKIDDLVNAGKLLLFKINNKDFRPYSKGSPNLHTLYWKLLFDDANLSNVIYKLNGEAELFYRRASIPLNKRIIHPTGQPIDNKNPLNAKKQSRFEYDIVKDKRFTMDKYFFHVPITMNFKAPDSKTINEDVLLAIKNNTIQHIIGIDRGERHLLYISIIDLSGNIIDQFSLNEISNKYRETNIIVNYQNLLEKKSVERNAARKDWKTIENIKEIKEGFLSQVIHKITELIVKYNAIVILEDLNSGFKRGRQKFEKQVYQKFEKMLIDKLNYLVFKGNNNSESGGLLNALQLTNKFVSFQKMGRQNGILFYLPAWNTSKIDPVSGFVDYFQTMYKNIEESQQFFNNFDYILFNKALQMFEFKFDYKNFINKEIPGNTKWIIYTNGKRIKHTLNSKLKNPHHFIEINLTDEIKRILEKNKINYNTGLCFKKEIVSMTNKDFFIELLQFFKLVVQLRNSDVVNNKDYIISPVMVNNHFFNSEEKIKTLPLDADANGAYNIARKGLCLVYKINNIPNLKNFKIYVDNKEYLTFLQK